jgi:hypothetical protein
LNCRDNQASAPQTDVAALHKQRLEEQHSQNAQSQKSQPQGELCLPGRIESTTAPAPPPLLKELPEVVDLPPLRKGPTSAAADAEFDYDRELKKGVALGGPGGYTSCTCRPALLIGVPNCGMIVLHEITCVHTPASVPTSSFNLLNWTHYKEGLQHDEGKLQLCIQSRPHLLALFAWAASQVQSQRVLQDRVQLSEACFPSSPTG